jgi:GH35 family endo-1,4-beta-xylanase
MSLRTAMILAACLSAGASAQIAKGATKFLGNITTNYSYVDSIRTDFGDYWNQITNENACKWGSVEATQNKKNWGRCDSAYKYAKRTGIPFRFHTLVWGSQLPGWLANLDTSGQRKAVTSWMDSAAARYPDAEMIDVVNEALQGHAPFLYPDALGGAGATGHDWVINSFKMARQRWPKAKLVLNDYNNLRWDVDAFIVLANKVKNADPKLIDAIGCQAHDLSASTGTYTYPTMPAATLKTNLKKLYDQIGLPIYITELDLSYQDDAAQLEAYKALFPVMWESEYVAGVTIWGYVSGKTWSQAAYSGLINVNGGTVTERPAMTWLKGYIPTKLNVVNPLPLTPSTGIQGTKAKAAVAKTRLEVVHEGGRLDLRVVRPGQAPVDLNGRN